MAYDPFANQIQAQQTKQKSSGVKGLFLKALSYLQKPQGALIGMAEGLSKSDDDLSGVQGMVRGWKENRNFSNLYETATGKNYKEASLGVKTASTIADFVLDPINLVGVGAVGKGIAKGAGLVSKTIKEVKFIAPVIEKVNSLPIFKRFAEMFVPGSGLPVDFYKSIRNLTHEKNFNIGKVIDSESAFWKKAALNGNDMDELVKFLDQGIAPKSTKVAEIGDQVKGGLDEIFDDLIEKGLAKEADRKEFYFPHNFEVYLKKTPEQIGKFKPIKKPAPGFMKERGTTLRKNLEADFAAGKISQAELDIGLKKAAQEGVTGIKVGPDSIQGWDKNAPAVLARYKIGALNTGITDDFIKSTMSKFGKNTDEMINKFIDPETGAVVYMDNMGNKFSEVASNIAKDAETGKELLLPQNVAKEFNRFMSGNTGGIFGKGYDKVLNTWKLLSTSGWGIPNVGYTTRNALGNFWNNYLGGVLNPVRYMDSAALQKLAKSDEVLTGRLGKLAEQLGTESTGKAVMEKLNKLGATGTGYFYGDISKTMDKLTTNPTKLRKLMDVMYDIPRNMNSSIENNARLAHILDRLGKGDDVEKAVSSMEKYLFDYTDLTDFENKVMKRIIPFYAWMRKNLPLQMEAIVKQPQKFNVLGKVKTATAQGQEVDMRNMPDWMQDTYMIQVPEFLNKTGQPLFWNPYMPFQDLEDIGASKLLPSLVGRSSPIIKMPFELHYNKDSFTGQQIVQKNSDTKLEKAQDYWNYFAGKIRPYRSFESLTNDDKDKFLETLSFFGFKVYNPQGTRSKK